MLKKYYPYLIGSIFIFSLWVYLQGTIGKILFTELIPIKVPQEFYRINEWLKKQKGDFKVAWLPPQFDARILEWNPDSKINDFVTISSGKPTIGPQAPYSKLYYLFLEKVIDNVPHFNRFFDILNTQYIIFRKDLPEDYSQSLLQNFRADSELAEVNLEKIDSHFFCQKFPSNSEEEIKDEKKEFFTRCGSKKEQESYLNVFQNKNFAPLFWIPENVNLVIGGMEALEILNSQENFDPPKEGLIFVNQETNILPKIKDLKFKNIVFNNADFQDLVFSLIEKKYIVELSSLTQEKEREWRKASTQEPLHGEWHEVINELKLPNWDFDFGKGLIYSERTGEKIIVPLPRGDQEKYFLIIRYFQNNRGGEFKLILENEEKVIETSNLNNKFTLKIFNLGLHQKEGQFLTIQNEIGFNAINLIALIPEEEYQKYQKIAQEILEKNKILYLQKISREMTIEPLEFNLPQEGNYEILVKSKVDQEENREEEIKDEEEKWLTTSREKIIDLEKLKKEKSEKAIYFGDKKYILNFIPGKKITWTDLDKRFFLQREKIPLSQRVKPANILTVNNFLILDQGNLELKVDPSLKTLETIKISNLFPKIEILQGAGVSERRGRLITDAIKVKGDQNFYLEYKFRGENLKGVDARVLFYGKDYHPIYQRTAFKAEYFMNDQKGNVEPTKFVHFFGTPRDTHYIKIEFKAEPNFEEESWFEISNFKLYSEEDLGNIEAIILSEDQEKQKGEVDTKPTVKFKKNSPTRYQISLDQTKEPFVLAFAESYDPMWKLKEKTAQNYFQKIFGSLFSKSNQEKTHFPLYSVINGFYIDPQELKTPELILEYEPQNWFWGGLLISLGSLILFAALFIIYHLVRKNIKKESKG